MADDPKPSDEEASLPSTATTVGDLVARLVSSGRDPEGARIADVVAKLKDAVTPGSNVADLLRNLDRDAPSDIVLESIREAATANSERLLGNFQIPRNEVREIRRSEIEIGPIERPEVTLLDGIQDEITQLREITAGQATNVAPQATAAEVQSRSSTT